MQGELVDPAGSFRPSLGSTPLGPSGISDDMPDVQNCCRQCMSLAVHGRDAMRQPPQSKIVQYDFVSNLQPSQVLVLP